MTAEAKKNDSGKTCRPELVPAVLIVAVGDALTFGAHPINARGTRYEG